MKTAVQPLPTPFSDAREALDVRAVHASHGDFVWASLQRLGVRDAALEDLFQEVFLVVHERGASFEGRSRLSTWLYGICLRVVVAHRRRAWVRREKPTDNVPEPEPTPDPKAPDAALEQRQAQRRLTEVLDAMEPERRALFVMIVIEEIPTEEVAVLLDVPVGTVHSRMHAARKQFEDCVKRVNARYEHRSLR